MLIAVVAVATGGCNAIRNGWLDPTAVGVYNKSATVEIRSSLTIEDKPQGIAGAEDPRQEDLRVIPVEYPISPGDQLAIEIEQLREVTPLPFQAQARVDELGDVNLPVVGRVRAAGFTSREFEAHLKEQLQERDILRQPQLTVNPLFLNRATYEIFGVGVSASNVAPLRAGKFPILKPDLRLLEAINQVGGLNEFVTDVYIFRREDPQPDWFDEIEPQSTGDAAEETVPAMEDDAEQTQPDVPDELEAQDLLDAVEPPQEVPQDLDDLEPEPVSPFLYKDGEFVPNPEYQGPSLVQPSGENGAEPPTYDSGSPANDWARVAGELSYRILRVSAESLRSGDPQANVVVRAGDVIRIVSGEIGVYYVMGQVNRVGPFAFNSEPITLKAAIASAGGLSRLAWPDRCTVYRRVGQREVIIPVDLDAIFAGKEEDFLILRGDIINVGTHPFAPFLQTLRGLSIPNPVSNVGYSFTYARNYADIDSFGAKINPANRPDRFPNLFP